MSGDQDSVEGLGFIPVPDDVAASYFPATDTPLHPMSVAKWFLGAILKPDSTLIELTLLVTPESLPQWGDFTEVAPALDGYGLASGVRIGLDATGVPAPDVAYIQLLSLAETGNYTSVISEPTAVLRPLVLTLVWRPEVGSWQVHCIGAAAPVAALPRTSPGVGPASVSE